MLRVCSMPGGCIPSWIKGESAISEHSWHSLAPPTPTRLPLPTGEGRFGRARWFGFAPSALGASAAVNAIAVVDILMFPTRTVLLYGEEASAASASVTMLARLSPSFLPHKLQRDCRRPAHLCPTLPPARQQAKQTTRMPPPFPQHSTALATIVL